MPILPILCAREKHESVILTDFNTCGVIQNTKQNMTLINLFIYFFTINKSSNSSPLYRDYTVSVASPDPPILAVVMVMIVAVITDNLGVRL